MMFFNLERFWALLIRGAVEVVNGRTPFASHSRMLYRIEVCYQKELARPEGAQGDVLKSEFWSMLHRKPLNPKPERHAVCNLLQDQA